MTSVVHPAKPAISTMLRQVMCWLFALLLMVLVVPNGSVNSVTLHLVSIAIFGLAAIATLAPGNNAAIRTPYRLALAIAIMLAMWLVIQATGFDDNPFGNPVWRDAEALAGPMPHFISVAPGDTWQGLIAVLLPFAVFLTTLLLFRSDREARALVTAIVALGAGVSLLGIIQEVFFPDRLLLSEKQFYIGSLTGVFVNRNTAANFIGMTMIVSAGLAFHFTQYAGPASLARFLVGAPSATSRGDAAKAVLFWLCAALAFVALMMTKSRAGIASSCIGLALFMAIVSYHGGQRTTATRSFSRRRTPVLVKTLRAALVVVVVIVIGAGFAGQALLRAEIQGTGDLRFCYLPGLLRMTEDNWLVGTGFGTFRDVFPAYRDPSCGLSGTLLQAHNFYLEGWITLGLPFPVLTLIVITGLVIFLARGIRHRRQYRWIPAAGLGVLMLQLLHSGVDFSIQSPGVAAVFSAVMACGVVVATARTSRSKTRRMVSTPAR
jgi:hypothetical protein